MPGADGTEREEGLPADPVVSRELSSLREELASARRRRPRKPAEEPAGVDDLPAAGTAGAGDASAVTKAELRAEPETDGQLRDLVKEIADFFDEAEENISAHPATSIVAALLLGIAIGSLLARR